MSRIRGIEAKKKKINEPDTTRGKDDVEKDEIAQLLSKIPKLDSSFLVHRKIGEGTFSSVYLGSLRKQAEWPDSVKGFYAIKHLVPTTHPTRVAHELRCLRDIGGKNHVIGVEYCFRNFDHVVFVMPYVPHRKFSEYVRDMDADELQRYMRALLTALQHVHTFGVIHRDVKPSNFLYDRERQRYALVDFGLAQHVQPPPLQPPPAHQSLKRRRPDDFFSAPAAKRILLDWDAQRRPTGDVHQLTTEPGPHMRACSCSCSCSGTGGVCTECAMWAAPRANRAGTQGFRPPEVLFKYADQGTAVDIWAAGVILASVLSGRYPFFQATDDMTALAEITTLLGSEAMQRTAQALGCRLVTSTTRTGMSLRKLSWHRLPAHACPPCPRCRKLGLNCKCHDDKPAHEYDPTRIIAGFPDSAFALAARLLDPNPRSRITAAEALRHPFLTHAYDEILPSTSVF